MINEEKALESNPELFRQQATLWFERDFRDFALRRHPLPQPLDF